MVTDIVALVSDLFAGVTVLPAPAGGIFTFIFVCIYILKCVSEEDNDWLGLLILMQACGDVVTRLAVRCNTR